MTADEAQRLALLEFGGREQIKQELREVHTSRFLESLSFNLRAALRFMRRSPSFSAAVILTLALGIGANSAVFSAIDAVVLRPLPFPDGDQLVALYQHDHQGQECQSCGCAGAARGLEPHELDLPGDQRLLHG